MPSIICTPGLSSSNSYLCLERAREIASEKIYGDKFLNLDQNTQEILLIHATNYIDMLFDFVGYRRHYEQALKWPRSGVVDQDGYQVDPDIIPGFVEHACFEQALFLSSTDITETWQGLGPLKSLKAGSVELVADKSMTLQTVSNLAIGYLQPYVVNIGLGTRRSVHRV